jgi:hypothetical protein
MTKISFNLEAEEVEITRTIRKTGEGRIKINKEGGGEVEINIGIAKIGGTTDYGGAITLGVFGQEVTWGREGGTIHLGIGGFEVDVEARDCIVTEIKSIYGNIVAQRSYPDPGCKLPDPPTPTPAPPLTPPGEDEPSVPIPDDNNTYWAIVGFTQWSIYKPNPVTFLPVIGPEPIVPTGQYPIPFTVERETIILNGTPEGRREKYRFRKGQNPRYTYIAVGRALEPEAAGVAVASTERFNNDTGMWEPYSYRSLALALYGTGRNLSNFFTKDKEDAIRISSENNSFWSVGYFFPVRLIALSYDLPLQPLLPTGNKPPMRDCCEEVLEYLADFEEAFEIRRLLEEKFPISNSFMAPECDQTSVTEAKTFYEIIQCVIRILAHGLIFEPGVKIKDADAAKAGDQEFKTKYLSATGWASAIAEALLEVKDDGNVSTNMDIRNAFAVTQTMVGLTDAIYKLEAIIDCLGIEVIPKVQTVDTPFNLQIQVGKGFGGNNERQIDLNTDEATEKLLPVLLQTKKNKIKTLDIHPRSRSLLEILENIEANLLGPSSG